MGDFTDQNLCGGFWIFFLIGASATKTLVKSWIFKYGSPWDFWSKRQEKPQQGRGGAYSASSQCMLGISFECLHLFTHSWAEIIETISILEFSLQQKQQQKIVFNALLTKKYAKLVLNFWYACMHTNACLWTF